jgi:hypothetical protein
MSPARLATHLGTAPGDLGLYDPFLGGAFEIAINPAGQVAAHNVAFPVDSIDGRGMILRFPATGSTPTTIAVDLNPAPNNENFSSVYNAPLAMNSAGQIAFFAATDTKEGIFSGNGTSATTIALAGDAAPGGGTFFGFNTFHRTMTTAGALSFSAYLNEDGDLEGLFLGHSSGIQQVARLNTNAPAALGGVYSEFRYRDGAPPVNAAGQVGFTAVNDGDLRAVLRYSAGSTSVLVMITDVAPNTGGGTFNDFGGVAGISDSGRVLFRAGVQDGNTNRGLFTADGSNLTAVVVGGQAAPGLNSVTFGTATNSGDNLPDDAFRINSAGGVAFWAKLTGTGVNTSNDSSLWYFDPDLGLLMLAREGQTVTVGSGDIRTLRELPDQFELSNAGLAYIARFTDGSQAVLFVNFTPVPEPAGVLAGAGLLILVFRRFSTRR